MTPDAAGIEAALAAGLAAHAAIPLVESGGILIGFGCPAPCSWGNEGGYDMVAHRAHVAAALLPVVTQAQAAERERIAKAIEDATLDATFLSDSEARGWWKGNADAAHIARADESGA